MPLNIGIVSAQPGNIAGQCQLECRNNARLARTVRPMNQHDLRIERDHKLAFDAAEVSDREF